jgi:hypothetical protein
MAKSKRIISHENHYTETIEGEGDYQLDEARGGGGPYPER